MATTAAATGAAVAGATTGSNKSGSNGSSNCISKGGNISNNMQQRQQQQDIATVSTRALYTIFACRARIADNLNVACQKKQWRKRGRTQNHSHRVDEGSYPARAPPSSIIRTRDCLRVPFDCEQYLEAMDIGFGNTVLHIATQRLRPDARDKGHQHWHDNRNTVRNNKQLRNHNNHTHTVLNSNVHVMSQSE